METETTAALNTPLAIAGTPEPPAPLPTPSPGTDVPAMVGAIRAGVRRRPRPLPLAVRRIDWETDLADYQRWVAAHGIAAPERSGLPSHGIVAEGRAAVLLYRTDSDIAFVDGLVTSPECPLRERVPACEAVLASALVLARQLGYRKAIAYPGLPSVRRLAERLGASVGPVGVMVAVEL